MRLNVEVQYGLKLVSYLFDGSSYDVPVSAAVAARELNLSRAMLDRVAAKLRKAGVLRSARGPNGGYLVSPSATVGQVISALAPVSLLTKKERAGSAVLNHLAGQLESAWVPHFDKSIRQLKRELPTI